MGEETQDDIRRLLKTFGVKADAAIQAHLGRVPGKRSLQLRLILADATDYGDEPPTQPLTLEVEGTIRH
jgi:hypothetical protein